MVNDWQWYELSSHINVAFLVILTLGQQSHHIWVKFPNTPHTEYIWNTKHRLLSDTEFFMWHIFWAENVTYSCWNSFLLWNIFKARCAHLLSFVMDDLWKAVRFAQTCASSEGAPHTPLLFSENINWRYFDDYVLFYRLYFHSRNVSAFTLCEGSWLAICIHNMYTSELKHLQLRYLRFLDNPLMNLIP